MPPFQGTFDANQFKPNYGFDKVLPGKYPAKVVNTEIQPTKDNTGGMFVITYQTPSGQIQDRFNLWNASPKAVEIAHGQLSAVCHATGVFRLDWSNEGAALRGADLMIEVGWQKGQEPTQEKPDGGYTEVKRLFDRNGNEPGKAPAQQAPQGAQQGGQQWQPPQQQQPQQQAPMTQQPNGGWGPPQQQPQQQAPQQSWGNPNPQPQQQTPQQAPQGNKPPWAQ